jgi:2,4-dienoyl-CoA reductase-like NADH-dependent reductase (Old Yellow Enzyme family)
MTHIFEPGVIGTMTLRNRLVKSATFESMSGPNGECTEELRSFYRRVAEGGIGLAIAAFIVVHRTGLCYIKQSLLDRDEAIDGFRELTRQVHDQGAKIAAQLNHSGRGAKAEVTGSVPMGPSAIPDKLLRTRPEAMTEEQIEMILEAFAQAAVRAKAADFDAVELHCAHGYLISQFLSPATNQRTDAWGGTLENRQRFALEAIRRVRAAVGPDYPILVKLNSEDFVQNGFTLQESMDTAPKMVAAGVNALEISGGFTEAVFFIVRGEVPVDIITRGRGPAERLALETLMNAMKEMVRMEDEAYFLPAARAIKPLVNVPIISVGGMRSRAVMDNALQEGAADFISMARPLIREPDLPNKFLRGESDKATCFSCNRCLMEMAAGNPLRCYYPL